MGHAKGLASVCAHLGLAMLTSTAASAPAQTAEDPFTSS